MIAATQNATLLFVAIPLDVAERARATMRDDFGHELKIYTTTAPCRLCLRISTEPEELLLLSYQPLPDTGPYAEVGPIFIHAHGCEQYADTQTFPSDFASRPLILRAYNAEGEIADAVIAQPGEAEARARTLFADADHVEIHVRHISYTCFDFKILRA